MMGGLHIGIDFDNTLVSYDHLFNEEADGITGFTGDAEKTKKEIRDAIRGASADGEEAWQHLQARVYGHRMADAVLMEGADAFLMACKTRAIPVSVVSHKTRFARRDAARIDLRQAALAWMEEQGFFDLDVFAVRRENVYFEPTRDRKILRIAGCACTDFIDDLEEVFREASFPLGVRRHLFAPQGGDLPSGPFQSYRSWQDVAHAVL